MKKRMWVLVVAGMILGLSVGSAPSQAAEDPGLRTGTWKLGGGVGFLAETPDDTAFALNLHGDRFFDEKWSVGPLGQFAFTSDLAQYAVSGQVKYWTPLPDAQSPLHAVFQGGVGVVHAAFQNDDTSWIVPLGVGLDYTVDSLQIYAMFLLNLTDLDTGRGTEADLMPGVTFGVKF